MDKNKDNGQVTPTEIEQIMQELSGLGENNASVEEATGISRRTLRRWRAGDSKPQRRSDIAILKSYIQKVKARKKRYE